MGFKMKGPSMHSGTAQHKSALKIKSIEARKQEVAAAGQASASGESSASPAKKDKIAYGGTKTWAQGQKDSGGTLNQVTKDQRAYEKKMKSENPDWNKREDNEWKKRQNKINAALGSKKVYDVTKDIATTKVDRSGDGEKDTKVMRGLGAKKGKTLTAEEKSLEQANISTQKNIIKKSKKTGDDDAKDKAQKEIGEIRSGRDDKYTGTVVSRFLGKLKAKRNQNQLDKREKKRTNIEKKYKEKTAKGKSTKKLEKRYVKKGGDVDELKSSPATYKAPKVRAKKDKRDSPAKIAPLVAMAGKAIAGKVAGKVVDKAMDDKK
jgi:hypothetical protein